MGVVGVVVVVIVVVVLVVAGKIVVEIVAVVVKAVLKNSWCEASRNHFGSCKQAPVLFTKAG